MKKLVALLLGASGAAAVALAYGPSPNPGTASSHREAPLISEDPSADNTDLYAFRSPDRPDMLTIVANWQPGEDPAAGPMWYTFSPSARYNVKLDRNGDGRADVTYRFRFGRGAPVAFLRNTAQPYTVTRIRGGRSTVVARGMTPPNNVGPRFLQTFFGTTDYRALAAGRVKSMRGGGAVFAGQREDAFFGDIGAIFDMLAFRRGTGSTGGGKDFFAGYAVHAVALQIPIPQLDDRDHILGVWATTERKSLSVARPRTSPAVRLTGAAARRVKWVQVSRLGNPLVNEVIIPTELKDRWNRSQPRSDGRARFSKYYREPILAALINQLYPGVVNAPERDRDDLVQVFLTGIPKLNFTGPGRAEMLRINLSIPPTPANEVNRLGVLGGDLAGYPNGRRLEDDVIDIAEQAVAGILKGNERAKALGDGVDRNDVPNLAVFPYENDPPSGFANTKGLQQP
jgi:Domain of unknown function (DUF4331)